MDDGKGMTDHGRREEWRVARIMGDDMRWPVKVNIKR